MKRSISVAGILLICLTGIAQHQTTMSLNGTWKFDQTLDAFPPKRFSRSIPVPGLITQASPRIEQYDRLFAITRKPEKEWFGQGAPADQYENRVREKYQPRYNWYRRTLQVPAEMEGKEVVLTLKKSKYVTQVYVNGMDMGSSMACYTPLDFRITGAVNYGRENEILIRVGDYAWLPPAAAGSSDKEKHTYIPGIWDDVELSFTEKIRVHRCLVLPDIVKNEVLVKLQIESFYPSQLTTASPRYDSCSMDIEILESASGKMVSRLDKVGFLAARNKRVVVEQKISLPDARLWTIEDPFLYEVRIHIREGSEISDIYRDRFGMREFGRRGRYFTLNGQRIYLRGTNITLHRFFEDPDCKALPWDSTWVRKLLVHYPKQLHWNAMRVCVGITPDFWYDIADESGLLFQNEWLFWQDRGWDEQIRKEFTDWVWSDGNHPSIAIWDALNENRNPFLGKVLIPELKALDPTRIWDAGYMSGDDMNSNEMDEPHTYRAVGWRTDYEAYNDQHPFALGDLHDQEGVSGAMNLYSSAAQLVNEYACMWLWRDGSPAKLTLKNYRYYLGDDATTSERRELQAYWTQLETEWHRVERMFAGVLSFAYLTNNYGYTGDWFINDIKDLEPGPALKWQAHCFAPVVSLIDLVDGRYTKHTDPYEPSEMLAFNLIGVNDTYHDIEARTELKLFDDSGGLVLSQEFWIPIMKYGKKYIPVVITLPRESGGYTLVSECYHEANNIQPVVSRRYIKVGKSEDYSFYNYPVSIFK